MFRTSKGFTILEIVLGLSLLGILALIMAPGFLVSIQSFDTVTKRSRALAQGQSGLERMAREIRLIPNSSSISNINENSFTFEYPEGNSITYDINASTIRRNGSDFIENAESLLFTYFDESSNNTSNANDVRSVGIALSIDPPGNTASLPLRTRVFIRNVSNNYEGYSAD